MNSLNQLSVALARFPFSNQIDYKFRPVLIISNENFNKKHNYFLTCAITSKKSLTEFEIEISKNEFSGILKTESFIRSDSIASLEKELILKEIGKITPELFKKIKKEIINNIN
jgi:mRNA interferase MazF